MPKGFAHVLIPSKPEIKGVLCLSRTGVRSPQSQLLRFNQLCLTLLTHGLFPPMQTHPNRWRQALARELHKKTHGASSRLSGASSSCSAKVCLSIAYGAYGAAGQRLCREEDCSLQGLLRLLSAGAGRDKAPVGDVCFTLKLSFTWSAATNNKHNSYRCCLMN